MDIQDENTITRVISNQFAKILYIIIPIVIILGSIIVLLGWIFQQTNIVQPIANTPPMQFNTTFCFLMAGIGYVTIIKYRLLATIIGICVAAISLVTFLEYIFSVNLYIDTLFYTPYYIDAQAYPGRMSPNTAINFILTGFNIFAFAHSNVTKKCCATTSFVTSVLIGIVALAAIFGYLSNVIFAYSWGSETGMAIHTALFFILISITSLALLWNDSQLVRQYTRLFLPLAIGCSSLLFFLIFFFAFVSFEHNQSLNKVKQNKVIIIEKIKGLLTADINAVRRLYSRINSQTYQSRKNLNDDAQNYIDHIKFIEIIEVPKSDYNYLPILYKRATVSRHAADMLIESCRETLQPNINSSVNDISVSIIPKYLCLTDNKNNLLSVLSINTILNPIWENNQALENYGLEISWDGQPFYTKVNGHQTYNELIDSYKVEIFGQPLEFNLYLLEKNYFNSEYSRTSLMFVLLGIVFSILAAISASLWQRLYGKNKQFEQAISSLKEKDNTLKATIEQYHLTLQSADMGTWHWNVDTNESSCDNVMLRLFDIESNDEINALEKALSLIHPDDQKKVEKAVSDALTNKDKYSCDYRIIFKDGSVRFISARGKFLVDPKDNTNYLSGVCWDTTEQKIAKEKATEFENRTVAMDEITDGWWDWNLITNEEFLSPGFKKMFGYEDYEMENTPEAWQKIANPDDVKAALDNINTHIKTNTIYPFYQEMRYRHKDGHTVWVINRGKALKNAKGEFVRMVGTHTDITQAKINEEKLKQLASNDTLTKLPNRRSFIEQLNQSVERAKRSEKILAVFFIDVDNFKAVNDNYGHTVGDKLLIHISEKLQSSLRVVDYLARLSGDEFAVILSDVNDTESLASAASRFISAVNSNTRIDEHNINCTLSIGIAIFSNNEDAATLLQQADTAMYSAKEQGKNKFAFYSANLNERYYRKTAIEAALHQAVQNDEFMLFYQPQIDITNNRVVGVEALIRWKNTSLNNPTPDEFIPIAESNKMIIPIGNWVAEQSIRDCVKILSATNNSNFEMAINVSTKQLESRLFVEQLESLIRRHKINPNSFIIEITETNLMLHVDSCKKMLKAISDIGVKIALDDFGTGYSSLTYLKALPFDFIKVDKSFIDDILVKTGDSIILKAIINLANDLSLPCIAEGVETQEQVDFLRAGECRYVQGYFYAKPMPLEELIAFIKNFPNQSQ